jgi:N-formylglutamate amidohydrolase
LIIDCHSFSSVPLPHEPDQTPHRPDFCIGADAFHTPSPIRDAIVEAATLAGYSVSLDAPFAGALVPLSSYPKDGRVWSVMIEVNRSLYMDENSGQKGPAFDRIRATFGALVLAAARAASEYALIGKPV